MLPDGFRHLPGYFDGGASSALLDEIRAVLAAAPLYTPRMPRTGKPMSVRMSNCGAARLGDRQGRRLSLSADAPGDGTALAADPGQRCSRCGATSPPLAPLPEACLINYYAGAARLGSHVDADERT